MTLSSAAQCCAVLLHECQSSVKCHDGAGPVAPLLTLARPPCSRHGHNHCVERMQLPFSHQAKHLSCTIATTSKSPSSTAMTGILVLPHRRGTRRCRPSPSSASRAITNAAPAAVEYPRACIWRRRCRRACSTARRCCSLAAPTAAATAAHTVAPATRAAARRRRRRRLCAGVS